MKDPARDWFGAGLMALLIAAGYYKWVPGHLSEGMIVCAAVIGIFPIVKNAGNWSWSCKIMIKIWNVFCGMSIPGFIVSLKIL